MHSITSRLPKFAVLLLSLGLLASCTTNHSPAGKEVAPYYVASVKIDSNASQADIEAQYGGSSILFNPKAGFAVLGFSKEAGELSTLSTSTNQDAFGSPELEASGVSAWSSGYSAWAGGYSAWAGGWSAWANGQTTTQPPLPEENQSIFNQIKLPQAHDLSHNFGQGIKVAVIDTGIDLNHPIFQGRLAPTHEWKDFVDNDNLPQEENSKGFAYGHGTAAAGIVLQVAPLATILPIRVLGPDGQGDLDDLLLAIEWAVQMGADVINLSLGTQEYVEALFQTIEYTLVNNVYVVAAAGNTGNTNMYHPAAGAKTIYDESKLISIGSVDKVDNKSSFSSYGSALEYVAPGEKIFTSYPDNRVAKVTGTSFATPLAAGTLALYMSDASHLDYQDFDAYLAMGSDYSIFSDGRLNVAGGYTYLPLKQTPNSFAASLSLQGNWKKSGGQNLSSTGNPRYSFKVTQTGLTHIDLSSTVDTFLYLLNSSGQMIASDDDSGGGYNSRIQMTLAQGTYTVVAATYSNREYGSFNLTVSGNVNNLK